MSRRLQIDPATRGWSLCALASAVYALAVLHRTSLGVRAEDVVDRYHVDSLELSYLAAASILVYALTQIPVGLVLDQFGPRTVLVAALLLLGGGSVLLGIATSTPTALLARLLLGMGDACTFLAVLRVAASVLPVSSFPLAAAFANACGASGQLIGTFPLKVLLGNLSWGPAFILLGSIAFALLLPIYWWIPHGFTASVRKGQTELPQLTHRALDRRVMGAALGHSLVVPQFYVLTAAWGHPIMTHRSGVSATYATAVVAVAAAVFGIGSGVMALKPAWSSAGVPLLIGISVPAIVLWSAVAILPRTEPHLVTMALGVASGAAAACAGVAYGMGRREAAGAVAGTRSGVVNAISFGCTGLLMVAIGVTLKSTSDSTHLAPPAFVASQMLCVAAAFLIVTCRNA